MVYINHRTTPPTLAPHWVRPDGTRRRIGRRVEEEQARNLSEKCGLSPILLVPNTAANSAGKGVFLQRQRKVKGRAAFGASRLRAGLDLMATLQVARTQTCEVRWRSTSGMAYPLRVLGLEYPSSLAWTGEY